jgi:hypothetical protein
VQHDGLGALIDRGHLTGGDGTFDTALAKQDQRTGYGRDLDYALIESGDEFLVDLGLRVPPRRRLVRYCVDWSEQRHHLAGALGRSLLDRLTELDWIRRADATRAMP